MDVCRLRRLHVTEQLADDDTGGEGGGATWPAGPDSAGFIYPGEFLCHGPWMDALWN